MLSLGINITEYVSQHTYTPHFVEVIYFIILVFAMVVAILIVIGFCLIDCPYLYSMEEKSNDDKRNNAPHVLFRNCNLTGFPIRTPVVPY